MADELQDVLGAEIHLTIEAGRRLVPKDGTGLFKMGKKSTSDPYVIIKYRGTKFGQTAVCPKTLDPKWSQTFKLHIDGRKFKLDEPVVLALYDRDRGVLDSDDPMGEVRIPLRQLCNGAVVDKWHPVQSCKGCNDATGDVHVMCSVALRRAVSLAAKQKVGLPKVGTFALGLGWDMLAGNRAIDLDASCVALDFRGQVLKDECVYYGQLLSKSAAIRHTGDEREGDEVHRLSERRLPRRRLGCTALAPFPFRPFPSLSSLSLPCPSPPLLAAASRLGRT